MTTTFSSDKASAAEDARAALDAWMRKALSKEDLAAWGEAVAPPRTMDNVPGLRLALAFSRYGWTSDADLSAEEKLLAYMIGRSVVMGVDEAGRLLMDSSATQPVALANMKAEAGALLGDGSFMNGCASHAVNRAFYWLEKAAQRLGWTESLLLEWKARLGDQLHREWKQVRRMMFACMDQSILMEMYHRRMPMNGMVYHWLLEGHGAVRRRRIEAAGELGVWIWYALAANACDALLSDLDAGGEPWELFPRAAGVPESILRTVALAFGRAAWGQTSVRVLGHALELWRRTDAKLWPVQPADMRACISLLDFTLILYSDFKDICEDAMLAQMQWAAREGWRQADRLINGSKASELHRLDPGWIVAFWLGPMAELADKLDLRRYACTPLNIQMQWSRQWRKISETSGEPSDMAGMLRQLVMQRG